MPHHSSSFSLRSILAVRRLAIASLGFASALPLALSASSDEPPPAIRMVKTALSTGEFYEPTEMAILPNLDVLIAQRRGEILLYDQQDKEIYRVGFLDAYFQSDVEGVNAEEGVLGMAADPDFANNNFVYIFYSPREKSVNRLSRFVFKNRALDIESEKVVLEFFSQRDICCHTGGSIAFGPDRLLYLSTGDNSTPFNEKGAEHVNDGFAPLNDLPGKEQFDARRSAANSNDLRGKILRIRVLPDGSYEIPEGNLFPASDKTRPEIFTMGHRNPYRISVDRKTGAVYWGDVGPDANEDKPERGPRGYDEMNRAATAGNYGWPLFVGDNFAYRDFDYATGESGPAFDPASPVNDSANNTGLRTLPPARPPFIWYPYGPSSEFPIVGSGGRNAMAGPVYHKEFYPEATRLADYYDGKVIMHDWIRNWFIAVTFDDAGAIQSVEPFLSHLPFAGPIDVEMGPDGRMYVLEYGSGWFQKNPDSGLSRIDYLSGNLPPQIAAIEVERESGALPFHVVATADVAEPEGESMSFTWRLGEIDIPTEGPTLATTIESAGPVELSLIATDASGSQSQSRPIQLYAGNGKPSVSIKLKGNQSFYFPDRKIAYRVNIADDAKTLPDNARVTVEMTRGAPDSSVGHQVLSRVDEGKILVAGSDCRACHKENEPSIGPSYMQVAQRYRDDSSAETHLSNKILNGGAGVWGQIAMPAHPSLSESDVSKMVAWIRSHAADADSGASLPLKGTLDPASLAIDPRRPVIQLQARYTDAPSEGLLPLTATSIVALRPNTINRFGFAETTGFANSGLELAYQETLATAQVASVDLKGIRRLAIRHSQPPTQPVRVEIRLDSPQGELIGSATIEGESEMSIRLKRPRGSDQLRDVHLNFMQDEKPAASARLTAVIFEH